MSLNTQQKHAGQLVGNANSRLSDKIFPFFRLSSEDKLSKADEEGYKQNIEKYYYKMLIGIPPPLCS